MDAQTGLAVQGKAFGLTRAATASQCKSSPVQPPRQVASGLEVIAPHRWMVICFLAA